MQGHPDEIPFDYSGGIVLVSAAPFGGGPTSSGNTIQRNTAYRNAPADIVDHSGGANTFWHNFCSTSMPGGLCQGSVRRTV